MIKEAAIEIGGGNLVVLLKDEELQKLVEILTILLMMLNLNYQKKPH